MKISASILALLFTVAIAADGGEPAKLKGAAPNTWAVLHSEKSDARMSVLLFWAPEVGRVIRAGGATRYKKQGYGANHTLSLIHI